MTPGKPQPLHFLRTVVAVVLLALAVGCGNGPPAVEPLAHDARVLAFGNSLTHGTGARPGASYPAVLADLIDREVINAGVPGEETAAGRDRLATVLERERPDLLILGHGGNDILHDRDLDAAGDNLAAMVAMAQARGIDVVLIGVPERSLFSSVAAFYGDVAREYGTPLEDGIIREILTSAELRSDRVHPNAAGYRAMAAAVHELLVEAGAVADG